MTSGLEGIVVAQTILSEVDGVQGRLIVRGHSIEELTGNLTFEAMAALLWQGLSNRAESETQLRQSLGSARVAAYQALEAIFPATARLSEIEGLRLGLSALSDDSALPHHLLLTAAVPLLLAATSRIKAGLAPLSPDPELGHVADFLRMLRGRRAPQAEENALEAYLVTVAEHGMNASTFTARVIASTQAGTISAVVGALCALKGPLHGGAPGPVLDMLDAIENPENIPTWLQGELAAGRRLMGFGHRIYRVRDPRADVLKGQVAKLRDAGNARLEFAERLEREAIAMLSRHKPDRPLQTNVEFYTALLLEAVGLPRPLFTPVFAMGRVLGWTAHVLEQTQSGRLIRPQSEYVGPRPEACPA